MEHNINIEKIGMLAYDMLSKTDEMMTIHSIFSNAVNIVCREDYIITLLPTGYSCGVQSIILSKQSFDAIRNNRLQAGRSFTISLKTELEKISAIDLTIPNRLNFNDTNTIISNISCCICEMENNSNHDGLAAYLFGKKNIYTEMLDAKIGQIHLMITQTHADKLADKLCGILGLGPGLTPSGDDFIYGFMSSLFYCYKLSNSNTDWISLATAKVANAAKTSTTIISYNMLRSCINGEFSEAVRNLLIGIFCSNNVELLLQKVLQIGSSSGADIATGILYGLKILLMKEE